MVDPQDLTRSDVERLYGCFRLGQGTQNPVGATPCEFDSHLGHFPTTQRLSTLYATLSGDAFNRSGTRTGTKPVPHNGMAGRPWRVPSREGSPPELSQHRGAAFTDVLKEQEPDVVLSAPRSWGVEVPEADLHTIAHSCG